jgi:hypothetical protein
MTKTATSILPLPRIDARNEQQRNIAKHLREQHLPGVDTDDDASIALEIEQARLILFASGAVIAFEVTQLLSSSRQICARSLYWSLFLLFVAMCGSWIALLWSEHIRRFRVDRRYKIYAGELQEYLDLKDDDAIGPYRTGVPWWGQITLEKKKRRKLRYFRWAVAATVGLGIGAGVLTAIGTADPTRCHFEILAPQPTKPAK